MALQGKAIKAKITAVGNIKKITKTMQMVAASKMRRAVDASLSSRDYALSALEILVHLSQERNVEHPMIMRRDTGKTLCVIIASNKGLCGGYNVNVSRRVNEYVKAHGEEIIECVTVGKQAEKIAKRNNLTIIATFTDFKDFAQAEDAAQLINVTSDLFSRDDTYQKVMIAYTQFVKPLTYDAKIKPLLPIQPESLYMMITDEMMPKGEKDKIGQAKKLYMFEPSEEEVMNSVIPELLTAVAYQVFLDAYASEHSSRMVAMQNATDNAGDLQQSLKLSFNKARQAAITQEIAEISAGANAL
ncbi:MAG: ATP synthase F1 subunit gamma [Candidatus Pacebacteria bacterium]|nr:ATP synthase F1 subunit gamma [Candidatus Paceibacterota bacterium]